MKKEIFGCIGVIFIFVGSFLSRLHVESIKVGESMPDYIGYTGLVILILGVIIILYSLIKK